MRFHGCRLAGGLISKTAEILGGQHQERASLLAMWQLSRELLPTGQVDGTKTFSVVGLATRSTLVSQEVGMGLTLLPTSFKPTSLASTRSFAAAGADQGSSSTSSAKANADATSAGSSAGEGANKDEQEPSSSGTSEEMAGAPCPEELMTELKAKEEGMAKLAAQVQTLTEGFKRSLADMENLRIRTAKEVDNAKKFALQKFVKDLLDVIDNLERATSAVPKEMLTDAAPDGEKVRASLKGLLEGVQAVESIMLNVLKRHGVERYDPINAKFDPNLHSALFEIPDASREAGTVAAVAKRGYMLNERIIRPAEVGVVKQP